MAATHTVVIGGRDLKCFWIQNMLPKCFRSICYEDDSLCEMEIPA